MTENGVCYCGSKKLKNFDFLDPGPPRPWIHQRECGHRSANGGGLVHVAPCDARDADAERLDHGSPGRRSLRSRCV